MRQLFFPGYYSGFSNNLMSLEIGVALAHLTGRTLVPYRFRLPRRTVVGVPADQAVEPMLVPEMFDIPVPYSSTHLFKTWLSRPDATRCDWAPLTDAVFCANGIPVDDDEAFRSFRNDRLHAYAFTAEQHAAPDLHIRTEALAFYSYFLYLDATQRRAVIDLMRQLRPKAPYREAADQIVQSLGPFNAIHIRRGDFLNNELTRHKISRTEAVTGDEIVRNLAAHMPRHEQLVICSDGSPDEPIFAPIRRHFRHVVFLDRYLREHEPTRTMLASLDRYDESVDALITQLTASQATVFAGTFFSTFTSLIHRRRGFERHESHYLFTHNDFRSPRVRFHQGEFLPVADGPFSWNRIRYPLGPGAYSWIREWPEASDSPIPVFDGVTTQAGRHQPDRAAPSRGNWSMEPLSLSCYGVAIRIEDETSGDICRRLRDTLPPQFSVEPSASAPAITYVVNAISYPESAGQTTFVVARDGTDVFDATVLEDVAAWLRQELDLAVAQNSRARLFVHAGVVGWRGWAILIPGRSHSGKSTLVAEFVRRGAVYYSDEYAVLDEDGKVHPYSRIPVLRGQEQTVNDLRLVREDEPTDPLPVAVIVSGAYRADATWRPAIIRGTRAVLPIIEGTVLAREESEKMLRIVSRIGESVVTLASPRPEGSEVAAQVMDLIDAATASRALCEGKLRPDHLGPDLSRIADLRLRSRAPHKWVERRLVATRHLRITDFLSPEEHQKLLTHALDSESDFEASGVVDKEGASAVNYGFRRSRTLKTSRLEETWQMFERRLRAILPGVRAELDLPYFSLGGVERQLTAHSRGGFFAPHKDVGHDAQSTSRRISCVYYFHGTPRRFTGGELRLYDDWVTPFGRTGAGTYSTIEPLDNSLVFFPSDSFHEVRTVYSDSDAFADSRFTVTIWFHEKRPAVAAAEAGQPVTPATGASVVAV